MDSVLAALGTYFGLLLLFRITGERTLGKLSSFDFVVLMLIGRATTGVVVGNDFSVTNALLVIATLAALQVAMNSWKRRSTTVCRVANGVPVLLVANGELLQDALRAEHVDRREVLQAAREKEGLERLDQIKYAVLETTGDITIIKQEAAGA
jgi:uncharacterized membrane protein YcaP (DUF421 family)